MCYVLGTRVATGCYLLFIRYSISHMYHTISHEYPRSRIWVLGPPAASSQIGRRAPRTRDEREDERRETRSEEIDNQEGHIRYKSDIRACGWCAVREFGVQSSGALALLRNASATGGGWGW
jgi:hypothetical protein